MHRYSFLILDHVVGAVEQRVWNGKSFSFGYVAFANRLPVRAGT